MHWAVFRKCCWFETPSWKKETSLFIQETRAQTLFLESGQSRAGHCINVLHHSATRRGCVSIARWNNRRCRSTCTYLYWKVEWFWKIKINTIYVVPNCCRTPVPKWHVLKLPLSLVAEPFKIWNVTLKWANFLYIFKGCTWN